MNKNLIFITYDGIHNPVFAGQVLTPILNKIEADSNLKVYLITFEKDYIEQQAIDAIIPKHENLIFIKFKRLPVLGKISLLHSAYLLKKFLSNLTQYNLIARGPLAGWVALNAINKSCASFTVQARGLIAIEYELIRPAQNWLDKIRMKIFKNIEAEVYNPKQVPTNFTIESITPALSDYLIETYNAKKETLKIAQDDFPNTVEKAQREAWRSSVRNELNININTHVYCYNGSAKPWQSLDLTIDFFKEKLKTNKNIFLLILTQDEAEFKKLLFEENINELYFKVLKVKHTDIYKYLSAADTGLIFRKPHMANWISRPIKAMEYEAVGMNIVHNNSVKWLIDYKGSL